ncbi:MAG: tRNA (adenosine(37)-N6)-dimethylallyltransferase MiaA [bacterium]
MNYDELIKNKTMIAIVGPTASGKTGVSIELSKFLDIEIISADSRQIYKYLDIGTATPTKPELNAVKTHFINILNPDEYYSAGKFGDDAERIAKDILQRNKIPVVAGGTGLYIQSLCKGFFEDEKDETLRKEIINRLEKQLNEHGIDSLYDKLKSLDMVSAEKYNDKNPRRIIRALEYFELTGIPFSEAQKKYQKTRDFDVHYFGIEYPRNELYERINLRAELMWKNGLVDEVKKVLSMGYSPDLNSLNTVGYKEAIAYLFERMSEEQSLDKMKQNTRRYAKRQLTWFRKNREIQWFSGTEKEIAEKIYEKIVVLSKQD